MMWIKRLSVGVVLLVASAFPAIAADKIEKDSLTSGGKKHTYYRYVPQTLSASAPAPLLILLHGSNRNGLSLAEKWKDLAAAEGIILVAPDSLDSSHWAVPEDGPVFIHDLVEAIKAKYAVDMQRIYLFGHSGGAVFGLQLSLYESEYFAATAIHAGALDAAGLSLIPLAKRKIPLFLQVGTSDPLFPVKWVQATCAALNEQGFSAQLTEIPNHDHWYYDLAPKINQAAWEFLKVNKLSAEPHFDEYKFRGQGARSRSASEAYNLGLERQRAGDLPAAIAAYGKAIELDSHFPEAYNNRGIAYFSQGENLLSIADFTHSIELAPSESAYNNRGNSLLALKRTKEAIADFTLAIGLKPSPETYYNRGGAYYNDGQLAQASADFSAAIKLNPKLARAYIFRGLIQLMDGADAAAQKDFDLGFQLDPNLKAEFEAQIQQMRSSRPAKP
jgi:poly(3-hydroxybutyrate) depolymerase/Flp pilus assembly protein TadD